MTQDTLSYDGYTLVFEDHFDGPELDRSRWNVELHEPGWVNEEWQKYVDRPENVLLEDGRLLIRPVKTAHDGQAPPDGFIEIPEGYQEELPFD